MRRKIFTLLLSLLSLSIYSNSNAQTLKRLFHKRATRQELNSEIVDLKRRVDSLRWELDNVEAIPIIDSTSFSDTLNPGALHFFEGEDFLDPAIGTDSLLSIWYVQKSLTLENQSIVDLDSANLTSETPDSIFIERLKRINSFIPLPYNNVVKNHIIYYTQRIPNKIDLILGLSNYYLPQFEEILDQHKLPKELKVMAIIESALNPKAVSRANAKGMWQFMYRTALQYNLKINSYVDERLDPIASGHAAAEYLKDSYAIFGDWLLAIASYNCGPGNVNKAIRRAGSREFWDVYPFLPRETRGYVPSFVAALYTLNYYKEHNIAPRKIEMPAHVDTFIIKRALHFGQVAELVGISKEELSDFNPQYINEIIPASEEGSILRIPYNYTNAFIDNEKELYSYKDSIFFNPIVYNKSKPTTSTSNSVTHVVRSGENLGLIARRYQVRVSDLQAWNGVKSLIKPGQRLTIYTSNPPAARASGGQVPTTTSGGYIVYTVKRGDTLWDISRKFDGVSLNQIMRLNGFNKNSKIMPGNKIKIKPA